MSNEEELSEENEAIEMGEEDSDVDELPHEDSDVDHMEEDDSEAGEYADEDDSEENEVIEEEDQHPAPPEDNEVFQESDIAVTNKASEMVLQEVNAPVAIELTRLNYNATQVSKLSKGQVIKLPCTATDPVNLVVENRVFAKGELVDVDGELGIRLIHLVSE